MGEAMRDYYVVLGVARTEGAPGLRTAYHDRARAFHQGRGDEQEQQRFRAVSEAYEALSDPRLRRVYDDGLRAGEARQERQARETFGPGAGALAPEPLLPVPVGVPPPPSPWTIALLDDVDAASVSPSFEGLRERLLRNFTGQGVPKSEHLEALNMEVLLTPEQATQGLALRVRVPTVHTCPTCRGSGLDWGLPCGRCEQSGLVEEDELVPVDLAAPARPGIREVPLEPLGIRNVRLRFHVTLTG
jgi:DnaJ-class molecular chaperone